MLAGLNNDHVRQKYCVTYVLPGYQFNVHVDWEPNQCKYLRHTIRHLLCCAKCKTNTSPFSWGLHSTYSKPRVYELPVACWPFLLTTIYKQCDVKTCCLSIKHQTLTCTITTCACSAYLRILVKTQKKRFDSWRKVQSLASDYWHLSVATNQEENNQQFPQKMYH